MIEILTMINFLKIGKINKLICRFVAPKTLCWWEFHMYWPFYLALRVLKVIKVKNRTSSMLRLDHDYFRSWSTFSKKITIVSHDHQTLIELDSEMANCAHCGKVFLKKRPQLAQKSSFWCLIKLDPIKKIKWLTFVKLINFLLAKIFFRAFQMSIFLFIRKWPSFFIQAEKKRS